MDTIKIDFLRCGTMRLRAQDTYIKHSALSDKVVLPNTAVLIRHPVHGNILIDTGWSSDCRETLPAHLRYFYDPHIDTAGTAVSQLADMGLKPEDIDLLILSHLDVDHTCALKDFAGKVKRIICPELEYFYSSQYVYKIRQSWPTWMPYEKNIERIYFRSSAIGPAKRGFDVFGDDSVICIYCPGHTDGIVATIVSRSPSNRFSCLDDGGYGGSFAVMASDVAFSQRNIDDLVVPGYGFNRKLQAEALRFLKQLRQNSKCVGVFCSHDPELPQDTIEF